MHFIVTRANSDGSFDEVGMRNRTLYSRYKTTRGLLRALHKVYPGVPARIEMWPAHCYGPPHTVHYVTL